MKSMPRVVLHLLLFLLVTMAWGQNARIGPGSKPHILVIHLDDFGYGDIAAYKQPCRNESVPYFCPGPISPNLDQMAAEGVRFTQWYTAHPVCTPSRGAILTGRYPIRLGTFPGVFSPQSADGLPHSEKTLAELLKSAGYTTAAAAKWHLGSITTPDGFSFLPTAYGFDSYTGIPWSHDYCPCPESLTHTPDHTCRPSDPPCPLFNGLEVVQQPAILDEITMRYANSTIAAMQEAEGAGDPAFVYWGPQHTHHPQFARVENINASKRMGGRPNDFGDSVVEVDEAIGAVMDFIRSTKWKRPVLVLTTSDNGPSLIRMENGGSPGELRCGKGTTWEGGQRVLGLAWGSPGSGVRSGVVEDHVASSLDIFPTLLGFAGVAVPSDRPIDGVDMSGLILKDGSGESSRDYFDYYGLTGTLHAVRVGDYKVHVYTSSWGDSPKSLCELPGFPFGNYSNDPIVFDLVSDPGENHPLPSSSPEYQAALSAAKKRMAELDCFSTKDACAGHLTDMCDPKNAPPFPPQPFHQWKPICRGSPPSEARRPARLCTPAEAELLTLRPHEAPADLECRPTPDHQVALNPYTFM